MRKIISIILLICIVLSMTACDSSKAHGTGLPETSTQSREIAEAERIVETTSSTEPAQEAEKSDSFGLTLGELVQVLQTSNVLGDFVTYDTPQYTVHRTGYGSSGALLFSSPESDKIEAALFLSYSRASRSSDDTEAAILAQNLLCEYCANNGVEYSAEEFEQEPYLVFAVYALDSALDNFPLSIRHLRDENEFFANEERAETFCNLMLSCNYQELKDFIDEYISSGQCPDYDVVRNIIPKVEEIISLMDGCSTEVDDVDKNAKIFFGNVTDISRETNVVPFVETSKYGASLNIDLGFMGSDWIFFDKISFASSSTETETFGFRETVTEVIDGGQILEKASAGSNSQKALFDICEKDGAVIRFKNTDTEEYVDHALTADEAAACFRLQCIRDLHDEIWDSLSEWEDA